jgi:putative FmdB family regulatory protein
VPLFDFTCQSCQHTFEALVRAQDGAPVCPSCGGADLQRHLSTFATSSAESRQAAATRARRKADAQGRLDNVAREREAEAHRREDH